MAVSLILGLLLSQQAIAFPTRSVKTRQPSYTVTQPVLHMSVPTPFDTITSGLTSIIRLPKGVTVTSEAIPFEREDVRISRFYDVENNPECRAIRERLTELDLVVETVVPLTKNSKALSDPSSPYGGLENLVCPTMLAQVNGKEEVIRGEINILNFLSSKFPVPVDPEEEKSPVVALQRALQDIGGYVAFAFRLGHGQQVSPAALPDLPPQLIILYSYEGNQFCRLVREVLCELDIPYELRNTGKGSERRTELAQLTGGSTQCPFLVDPNTQVQMAESVDICKYLYATYAAWTPPSDFLRWVSGNVLPLVRPLLAISTPLQAGSARDGKVGNNYAIALEEAKRSINKTTSEYPVVVYTYDWSPFSSETTVLLDRLEVQYHQISLGAEWLPGLLREPTLRAALLDMTGQSSLPHVFVGGESIGGLFSGTPGLVPLLEQGEFLTRVSAAQKFTEMVR